MAQFKVTVTWDSGASIRVAPTTNDANPNPIYPDNAVFYASELVSDRDDPTHPLKQWARIESDPQNGGRYAGRYVHGSSSLDLIVRDGKLVSQESKGDRAVIKIAENWFEIAARGNEPASRFKLLLDKDGRGEFVAVSMRALRREK